MNAYFCSVSGERIKSPGVSKNHGGEAEPMGSAPAKQADKAEDKSPEPIGQGKDSGAKAPKDKR